MSPTKNNDVEYNEIGVLILSLQDLTSRHTVLEGFLKRLLALSTTTPNQQEIIEKGGVETISIFLFEGKKKPPNGNVNFQQYASGILGNLALSDAGRLKITSCEPWNCISYAHKCPISSLLQLAQDSPNRITQDCSAAAVLNCSVNSTCKLQIEAVSGIPILLRLLQAANEDLALYAAASMWNLTKSPIIILKLETLHCLMKEHLDKLLARILRMKCVELCLEVTESEDRCALGIVENRGPNLSSCLVAKISSGFMIALHLQQYMDAALEDSSIVGANIISSRKKSRQSQAKTGTDIVLDSNGKPIYQKCVECSRLCRNKRGKIILTCNICDKEYHAECSRWKNIIDFYDDDDHIFYCDSCILESGDVEYLDFLLETLGSNVYFAQKSRPPWDEEKFDSWEFKRASNERVMIFAPDNCSLIGLGNIMYSVVSDEVIPDPENAKILIKVSDLFYAKGGVFKDDRNDVREDFPSYPKEFYISDPWANTSSENSTNLNTDYVREKWNTIMTLNNIDKIQPGDCVVWPADLVTEIAGNKWQLKSLEDFEKSLLYKFSNGKDEVYSIGNLTALTTEDFPQDEIWWDIIQGRSKCMKIITNVIGEKKKHQKMKQKSKKPKKEKKRN